MTPGKYDLPLYRGDTYAWQFTLWEDDDQTIESDLTDVTVAAQIRDRPGGTNLTSLVCTVVLPNIIQAKLGVDEWDDGLALIRTGAWDLQLTYTALDMIHTILAGKVTITDDVTVVA